MNKKISSLLLACIFLFVSASGVLALNNPSSVPNNKVGIHISSENELSDAKNLINSNGGDWGYVTIVITESERDHDRWQKVFDQMRRDHIIPLVRLATKPNGEIWDAPSEAEINNWVAFLNNLNWVTENRYVIINNEPNHSKEWGGKLDPAGYAKYLKSISLKLKQSSPDFFILPAGLDPAASNKPPTMSSSKFMREMIISEPDIFNYIDGWTSHPYPNASITSYKDELLIVNKKLPVFITETGWTNDKTEELQIAKNMVNAYTNVWNDESVIAVTPFILNYTAPPFNSFSWKKDNGSFYEYYNTVQKMPKVKGEPIQVESGKILAAFAEPVILSGMDFVGAILAKNTGQTIWTKESIGIGNESGDFNLKGFSINDIEPTKFGLIFFRAASAQQEGIYTNSIFITDSKSRKITNSFSVEAAFVNLGKDWANTLFKKVMQFAVR